LPINIKTIGEWILIKRIGKNLTSGHVAAKMGIAQSVVRSWEEGTIRPDSLQMKVLATIFGLNLESLQQ
jgi:DNA-binding transcriptional regulator YiaG